MEGLRNCVMCRRGLYRSRYQVRILSENLPIMRADLAEFIRENAALEVVFDDTQRVCYRCWQRAENATRAQPQPQPQPEPEPLSPEQGELEVLHVPEYMRAPNTPAHCIFRGCPNTTRHRIPNVVKVQLFTQHKIYIPDGARVCRDHLNGNEWDELPRTCNVSHDFTAVHFSDLCDLLRNSLNAPRMRFNEPGGLNEEEMYFWTGRTTEQFNAILEQTPSLRNASADPRTTLCILLTKLRTGDSNERLATLFNMSRRMFERQLAIARRCLNEYVELHLGLDHISRDNVLERNNCAFIDFKTRY